MSSSVSSETPLMRSSRPPPAPALPTLVPAPPAKVLRAWMTMPRSRANSTAWALSTFAPESDSSCISAWESSARRRAAGTRRGSAV